MPHSEELDNREVLAVHQLNIAFQEERQFIPAVENLSFTLRRGETLAIVGESGSGKSVTALALMRLLEQTGGQISSERMLRRRRNRQVIDLNELSGSQMQGVRGADIAMIFQEPMTSLNPVFPVGEQMAESIRRVVSSRGGARWCNGLGACRTPHGGQGQCGGKRAAVPPSGQATK